MIAKNEAVEPQKKPKKKKRRMRLPNGIGSVHQIGDGKNRRKPWRARVPAGVVINEASGSVTQKYITLGYYETEADAIAALFEYRKDPYTLDAAVCTFADVFEMWKEKKYKDLSKSTVTGYNSAFSNSAPLHKLKMRDIRTTHLDQVMQSVSGGYGVQTLMKVLWGQMFKYAIEHDIVTKNYAEFVKTRDKEPDTKRTAISADERERIWQAIDAGDRTAEIVMLYIYTGMRPSELLEVKKENVNLSTRIMIGGLKTDAGKDRHVPLHPCIMPIVERFMQTEGEFLIMRHTKAGKLKKMGYKTFADSYWTPFMERLGMPDYTMHYGRHTCATMMREAEIAEDIRKLILGHKSGDITDRYTHINDSMLVEAMDTVAGR